MFVLNQEEGKVELSDAQIKAASISIDTAGAARIKSALQLPGEIRLNEDRTSHVVPRIAGVVESVQASLGQAVKKGQVLAVIASPAASEQRSELQTAQKRLALAKTTFEREKRLWEQKISAEQDYLQAGQALNEAQVAVANAQQKLSALGLSAGSSGGLNRFELRAPFDGLVIESISAWVRPSRKTPPCSPCPIWDRSGLKSTYLPRTCHWSGSAKRSPSRQRHSMPARKAPSPLLAR